MYKCKFKSYSKRSTYGRSVVFVHIAKLMDGRPIILYQNKNGGLTTLCKQGSYPESSKYMMRNARKGRFCNLRTTQAQISLRIAQADLGLRCPLIKSVDTVVYIYEQMMLRSDCTDAHAELDSRMSHMA